MCIVLARVRQTTLRTRGGPLAYFRSSSVQKFIYVGMGWTVLLRKMQLITKVGTDERRKSCVENDMICKQHLV